MDKQVQGRVGLRIKNRYDRIRESMNEIFRQTGRRIALAACIQSESKSRSRGVGQIKTNPSANPILSLAEFTSQKSSVFLSRP